MTNDDELKVLETRHEMLLNRVAHLEDRIRELERRESWNLKTWLLRLKNWNRLWHRVPLK